MSKESLRNTIEKLENMFDIFNEEFFEDSLERPVITVSPDTKSAYGWCSCNRIWKEKEEGKEGYFEINICSEWLTRTTEEIAGTLLHEMVHLQNILDGVKDCSRGGTYHNKNYKTTAEKYGLKVSKTEKYGWAATELTDDAKDFLNDHVDKDCFELYRQGIQKEESKKKKAGSSRKYVCPVCGTSVRATKEVRIICADCDEEMILEKQEEEGQDEE